ncbi:MAG TPA: phytoene/squalene synthase family protein [Rubricoccaceae bacterium]|nr:phytoene/squalene synthase family protein [Rubricoccaceae bacterium]
MNAGALSLPLPAPRAVPARPPRGAARAAEDRYLRRAFRHHARTFSLAARLLPRHVRLPVATLYLYCRTVDRIADEHVLAVGPDRARAALDRARRRLDDALDGRPADDLLWRRLAEVHGTYGLPPRPLHQLLDGAGWDLDGRAIETDSDLLAYADLVAGSVGAMMLPFLVARREDVAALEAPARALGQAMQLTNVLRDVGEDARRLGRVYLPHEALAAHGLTPEDLLGDAPAGGPKAAYAALVESVAAQAEGLYDRAEAGIAALPGSVRTGIRAAARMYREILNEVRAAGYDNLGRRAVVPLGRKLRLVVHDDYARRRARLRAGAAA